MSKAAIFWDRDGTLIEDPGYLSDPEKMVMMPGAAEAVARLAAAGFENIVVSNQSGVARGLIDEATVQRINARLQEKLAAGGGGIDAFYYCPYLDGDEAVVERYRKDSDLRKPKPGMLLQAAFERQIDLAASWSIGDKIRDAEAGRAAGCRTILIGNAGAAPSGRNGPVDFTASSLAEAVDIVLKHSRATPAPADREPAAAAESTLKEILAFLRMVDKRGRAEDFSLARLAGALVQIGAIAALVWALIGDLSAPAANASLGEQLIRVSEQHVRLLYAVILQLIALTLFVLSGRK